MDQAHLKALETQSKPTMYFIGVTTGQSSIMNIFPKWTEIFGIDGQLVGYDAPINAEPEIYRAIVEHIKDDPLSVGALVTTHKISLLDACEDLFDTLDDYAQLCHEVSGIALRDGQLGGYALDPISSGLALDAFMPSNYWVEIPADVLCLGAGGAAIAISVYYAQQSQNAPKRFIIADIALERLTSIQAIHAQLDTNIQFEYHHVTSASDNDQLMAKLTAGSLVINATGLGKDRAGSPITNASLFPESGYVWELNYRGERQFMHQAMAQAKDRNLTVEDGWVYFIHGWSLVIAAVFDLEVTPELFTQLNEAALAHRSS